MQFFGSLFIPTCAQEERLLFMVSDTFTAINLLFPACKIDKESWRGRKIKNWRTWRHGEMSYGGVWQTTEVRIYTLFPDVCTFENNLQIQKWVPGGVHRRVCLELLTSFLLVWLLLSAESAMAELSSSVVYLPHLNGHQVHLQHNEFNIIMKNLHAWVNKQEHVLPPPPVWCNIPQTSVQRPYSSINHVQSTRSSGCLLIWIH